MPCQGRNLEGWAGYGKCLWAGGREPWVRVGICGLPGGAPVCALKGTDRRDEKPSCKDRFLSSVRRGVAPWDGQPQFRAGQGRGGTWVEEEEEAQEVNKGREKEHLSHKKRDQGQTKCLPEDLTVHCWSSWPSSWSFYTFLFHCVFFLLLFIPPYSLTPSSPAPILHFSISMFLAVYFHLRT